MKKIVLLVMMFTFFVSSYLSVKIFALYDYQSVFFDNNQTVHIEDKNNNISAKDFISDIEKTASDENLSIKRVVYTPLDNGKKQKIIYYVYNSVSDSNQFLSNLPLSSGRRLQDCDGTDKFLSNMKSEDSNQVGQINLFDNSNVIEIRPMSAMESHIYGTDFVLSTKSKVAAKNFATALSLNYNFNCTVNSENDVYSVSDNLLLYLACFGLIFSLCVLTAIAFLYYIIFRFKEIVIRKMFGSENKNIIHRILITDCVPMLCFAILLSAAATFVYLIFYNGLARFGTFILLWLICQLLLAILFLIVFCIFAQVVRKAKSSVALKNKKPLLLIKRSNYAIKILFSITAVVLFAVSSQNLYILTRQNSNISKWDKTKNYAVIGFNVDDSVMENYKAEYQFNCKMQHLFHLLNNNGAMLFSASSYYYDQNNNQYNQFPSYSPYKCSVCINNNYLKLNSIYDLNGNKINISDENTTDMTILVPEKYKTSIQKIKKLYQAYHTYGYYGARDRYTQLTGKKLNYDPTDKQQVLSHHEPLGLNIIYVKNNQGYFTYDPNVCKSTNNTIVDPIAMITNNSNGELYLYSSYVSRNEFRAKVSDYNNPLKSVNQSIIKAGLKDNIVLVTSLYDTVGEYMYNTKNQIAIEISVMLTALAIVILIVIFSTLNYLEESKCINAVKWIHGFSFIKRHYNYLTYPIIFWLIIYAIMLGLCFAKILSTVNIIVATLFMLLLEETIIVIILRMKESKKQKNILKGG